MAEISPVARALLETIAGPESAGDYNVIYGGSQFSDYGDHPRTPIMITSGPNKGKYSTAAGKYQFLGSTWDDQASKLGLKDFSPASQDAAAWNLAQEEYKRNTGRSLEADLLANDLSRIPSSLRNQWTSLPGGIEQGITSNAFSNAYARALNNPTSAMGYAPQRLPQIGPVGGPAINAINNATANPAQNLWSNPFQFARGLIPGVQQNVSAAAPAVRQAIAGPLLSSISGRTALMNALLPSNIGAAPTVAPMGSGRGTMATAVGPNGNTPVMLVGSGVGGTASASSPMFSREGQDMNVYRANREAVGAPINQSSIDRAQDRGSTLYRSGR